MSISVDNSTFWGIFSRPFTGTRGGLLTFFSSSSRLFSSRSLLFSVSSCLFLFSRRLHSVHSVLSPWPSYIMTVFWACVCVCIKEYCVHGDRKYGRKVNLTSCNDNRSMFVTSWVAPVCVTSICSDRGFISLERRLWTSLSLSSKSIGGAVEFEDICNSSPLELDSVPIPRGSPGPGLCGGYIFCRPARSDDGDESSDPSYPDPLLLCGPLLSVGEGLKLDSEARS